MLDITAPEKIRVTFFGTTYEAEAHFATYASDPNQVAIQLITDESGFQEPLATVSLNLEELGHIPGPSCIFVKDYGETEGLAKQLVDLGVAKYIRTVQFGSYGTEAQELELMGEWRAVAEQAKQARAAHDKAVGR
jgi:hypothetical protein